MKKKFKDIRIYSIVLDDQFGKINSHWAYSTDKFCIVDRVYYDEENFELIVEDKIKRNNIDVLAFSGRGAIGALLKLNKYFMRKQTDLLNKYKSMLKIMKAHNTNLSNNLNKNRINRKELLRNANDWARMAVNHPFDLIFIQTMGDAELINKVNGDKKAVWVPYAYNDDLYYDRKLCREVDIGAYFKLERHPHRIEFLNRISYIANKYHYTFEFSDKYWGEEYAKKISKAQIIVHLSYCGDIPWRLYECAASMSCFLTDRLDFGIENLFRNESYIEYKKNFDDLESKLVCLLTNKKKREQVVCSAYQDVKRYTWGNIVDNRIVPIINEEIERKKKCFI